MQDVSSSLLGRAGQRLDCNAYKPCQLQLELFYRTQAINNIPPR